MYPSEMEAKPFNPTSPHEDTMEAWLLKKVGGGLVNAANYVKGEFTGLFVSSIKFLPQSALLAAPSHLQHRTPPIHFNSRTFKVRQTGPFVSSPRRPQDSERQQAPCLA